MVWPIYQPNTFGICLPRGDYVGYTEGLKAFYEAEMSDEDKQALGITGGFMRSKFSAKLTEDLGPLTDVECPKVFKLEKTPKKLGSMIGAGLPIVSETLKNAIEMLEPDVHQFWPLTIEQPRNKTWPEQYYGLRIATFLDSFRPEQSKDGSFYPLAGRFHSDDFKEDATGLAFSRDVIAGKHLWREVNLFKPQMCMSDALQAAVAEKGLYLPPHWQAMEV